MMAGADYLRLAREGGWIVAGQIAAVAGALALVRVLTEYLDPTQYGQLALGLTIAGLANQMVTGGIAAGIARFYSISAERQDIGNYLRAARSLMLRATTVVVAIGVVLIAGLLFLGYSQWIGLALAALMLSVFSGCSSALSSIQNAARQRAIVALHGGLEAWLKIALAVMFVLWLGSSSAAVVAGYACSTLVISLSQLYFLRRTISFDECPTTDQRWASRIWSYSLPFSVFGGFTWLQQVSDRWALQAYASLSEVGQYAVLFQLGFTPITLVTGVAISLLGPILYQRAGDATNHIRNAGVHRLSWKLTGIALMVTLAGFAFSAATHERIFGILVALEYRTSSHLLPWVVLAGGIFGAGQILALKLMSELKSAAMTHVKIVTALIGVLLNVIGAALAGVGGVISALVAFSAVYFLWMAMLVQRLSKEASLN